MVITDVRQAKPSSTSTTNQFKSKHMVIFFVNRWLLITGRDHLHVEEELQPFYLIGSDLYAQGKRLDKKYGSLVGFSSYFLLRWVIQFVAYLIKKI